MTAPSRAGLALAIVYVAGAVYIIAGERRHPGFLPTMGAGLVTAPIGLPLEWLGVRLNLRSPAVLAFLLAANAALIFACALGAARLFGYASPFFKRSAR